MLLSLQVEEENNKEVIGFQQRENNLKLKVMQAEEQLSASMSRKDLMRLVQQCIVQYLSSSSMS